MSPTTLLPDPPVQAAPAKPGAVGLHPCLVVMQPTFFPWAGYFNLMSQADDFVFLDDVQLEKQSWQTRNRLALNGQPHWISVPVRHTHLAQTIAETEVMDSQPWRAKLARGFAMGCARHPHKADAQQIVDALVAEPATHLAALNEAVIRFCAARLGLTPRLHRASELGRDGVRSDRLISLCKTLGAREYLSPRGSADYLAEDRFAERSPAALRFQEFQAQPYPQKGASEHIACLSIVDVVANLGWPGARHYIQHGVAP